MQMNIAKVQSVLKNMPDQQLMQMLKRPDKIPSMFVQQELRRRQKMRTASEASSKGLGIKPQEVPSMPQQQMPQQVMGMDEGGTWFSNMLSNWKEGRLHSGHPEWNKFVKEASDPKNKAIVKGATNNKNDSENFTDYMASQQRENLVTSKSPDHIVNQTDTSPISAEILNKNAKNGSNPSKAERGARDWGSVKGAVNWMFPKLNLNTTSQTNTTNNNQTNTNNNQNLIEVKPPPGQGGAGYTSRGTDGGDPEINQPPEKDAAINEVIKSAPKLPANAPPNITINYDKTLAGKIGTEIGTTIQQVNDVTKNAQASIKGGITSVSQTLNDFKDSIDNSKFIWTTDELKQLRTERGEFYDEAYKFMLNDKSIVDSQKKLIDAMSPKATASNKFFSYLAQLGARIAGSDKHSFAQAAGEALDKTLSEVKMDNEAERQNFINQAKLGVELEEKRRANKVAALNFKSGYLNENISDVQKDITARNDATSKKIDAATKGAQLGVQAQQALSNMSTSLANLSLNQIGLVGDLVNHEITRSDNKAEAQANLEVELAKLSRGTPDIQLLEYYQKLDKKGKEMFKEVLGLDKQVNNSTVYSSLINAISKQITDLQANMTMPAEAKESQIAILNSQLNQMKAQFGIDVTASQSAGGSGQNYMTEEDF